MTHLRFFTRPVVLLFLSVSIAAPLALSLIPAASAQGPRIDPSSVCRAGVPSLFPKGYWGPLLSCSGSNDSPCPCKSLCDLLKTAQNIIYFGMSALLYILTPVMLLAGGVMVLISGGSSSMLGKGRSMVTGAVIGLAIGLGAFVIVNTFIYALNIPLNPKGIKGIAWPNIQCSAPAMPKPK